MYEKSAPEFNEWATSLIIDRKITFTFLNYRGSLPQPDISGPRQGDDPQHAECKRAGVDVMITIFCDFSQFSAKKLAFF
jgi:hypothetical protein